MVTSEPLAHAAKQIKQNDSKRDIAYEFAYPKSAY